MKERKGLTRKEKIFCLEYCSNGYNATKACIKAGYSEKTAANIGSQNLTKLHIKAEVERLNGSFESLMAEYGITKASLVQKHWEIVSTSIAHLHNSWIERKEFEKLTDEQKACIQEIDTKIEYRIDKEGLKGKKKIEFIKIKLYDKQRALDSISKIMGFDAPVKTDLTTLGKAFQQTIIQTISKEDSDNLKAIESLLRENESK